MTFSQVDINCTSPSTKCNKFHSNCPGKFFFCSINVFCVYYHHRRWRGSFYDRMFILTPTLVQCTREIFGSSLQQSLTPTNYYSFKGESTYLTTGIEPGPIDWSTVIVPVRPHNNHQKLMFNQMWPSLSIIPNTQWTYFWSRQIDELIIKASGWLKLQVAATYHSTNTSKRCRKTNT